MKQKKDISDIATIPNCGKCITIDNCIDNIEQYDLDSMFRRDLNKNTTEWPDKHDHFVIDQYKPIDLTKQLGDEILEKVRAYDKDFPKEIKGSYGAHEIRHHNGQNRLGDNWIGGIAPHSDRGWYVGITLFLNREWKKEWGAWNYIFNDNDGIDINVPKFNRAIVLYAPRLHGATIVFERDKVRRSLQIFMRDANDSDNQYWW